MIARNGESGSEGKGGGGIPSVAHAQLRICIHRGSCPEEESERGGRGKRSKGERDEGGDEGGDHPGERHTR